MVSAARAALTALSHDPTRVYPVYQRGTDVPSVVVARVGEVRADAIDGHAAQAVRIQVDIRAQTYADLEAIDQALIEAITDDADVVESGADYVEDDVSRQNIYRRIRVVSVHGR